MRIGVRIGLFDTRSGSVFPSKPWDHVSTFIEIVPRPVTCKSHKPNWADTSGKAYVVKSNYRRGVYGLPMLGRTKQRTEHTVKKGNLLQLLHAGKPFNG